ncbi:MAG: DnaJ domain-containing protein [Pseudomonadota bacterium]|nr:DnaJ domain-containing protein [Pseudomonadota bacterium]
MPYFILGLAVLVGVFLVVRGLRKTNSNYFPGVLFALVGLAAAAVIAFFVTSGRLGPIAWLLFLLPMIWRWRAIKQMLGNMRGPTPGKNSDIETVYLRMVLEHDTGVLRGTVLRGAFEGRLLEEMSIDDIVALLRECRVNDPRSADVLETYLDRVHGAEWRSTGSEGPEGPVPGEGPLTPAQAYDILGLRPGAADDEIREAHRTLLKANHPDRGGSTWLAAQINRAKDILLPGS